MLPLLTLAKPTADELKVVNRSGETIEIWASNLAKVMDNGQNKNVKLRPGKYKSWTRKKDTPEAVFVFRWNPWESTRKSDVFFPMPELLLGFPYSFLPII